MTNLKIKNLHEITEDIINSDYSMYDIITFDDGLYSQYYYHKHFLKYNVPLYFFISTNIVCTDINNQNLNITSSDAHKLYFEHNDKSSYMTLSQIKELYNTTNCFIGGHSHTHRRLSLLNLKNQTKEIQKECEEMMKFFKKHDIIIDSFAYPYNEELFQYKYYLKEIKHFFGKERE